MKYKVSEDIKLICDYLGLTQERFASEVGIPFETISRITNQAIEPTSEILEKIYSYIYSIGLNINKLKVEAYKRNSNVLFFHGSKSEIIGDISLNYSRKDVDFGVGFYTGDNYEQSLDFICQKNDGSIYILDGDIAKLNVLQLEVSLEWMFIIAYHRGKLEKFHNTLKYKDIKKTIEDADVIIAPIADNRMFTTLDLFIEGAISTEQAIHALKDLSLGNQIVFKTIDSLKKLKMLERLYVCHQERANAQKEKMKKIFSAESFVENAYQQYKRLGLYIDEVFKDGQD